MTIDRHGKVKKEDKPLTRADVERFLQEAGSSDKLNLSGRNLERISLANLILQGAFLREANLSRADLSAANLYRALQLHLFGGSLPDGHLGEDLLRLSERRHVGLEGSSHLLQSVNGEMLRVAQSVFVAVTMDAAIGHPTGPAFVA